MPRSEEANQRIREERREQILDASILVFARKGLAATKIADIAEASNISQGLIYRYFENKEDIFAVLMERALGSTVLLAQMALQQPGTPLAKLRWLLQQYLPGLWEQPEYALMVTHALTDEAIPEKVREPALEQARLIMETIQQLVIEGQVSGEVAADDPRVLTLMVLACIQGLVRAALYKSLLPQIPGPPDPEIILRMLKA